MTDHDFLVLFASIVSMQFHPRNAENYATQRQKAELIDQSYEIALMAFHRLQEG